MPFWSPPTTQATRPRPRLLAENGRTGLERGPQPHIIASPPGTGAPIDRINYTPDTGEVHAPGVLAPIDKLNYSLVPHDDLNYSGQLGQPSSPPGGAAQGGGAAGMGMSQAMQPQNPMQSNVWKNSGEGAGADSIVKSPGTPAGTDGLTGRYGENATQRSNVFSPGQPPLSPSPYGTGPGPRAQASGPITRPFDERASSVGNLGNWGTGMGGMGMGADDDGNGYDDDTGEPVYEVPEDAMYGNQPKASQGGTQPSGQSDVVTPQTSGNVGAEGAPTTVPGGYHFELRPPNDPGKAFATVNGAVVRQALWQIPDEPGRPSIPLGFYDASFKPGSSERQYTRYTEKEQRSMSPDYSKELDAVAKGSSPTGNHTVNVIGKDGNKHAVLVDKDGNFITDQGITEMAKPVAGKGDQKVVGPNSLHPKMMVRGADGSWTEDETESARLADEAAQKAADKAAKDDLDREARLAAAQSKPFTVYNDQAGQSHLVNTQTGDDQLLGKADPKAGIWDLNGRLVKIDPDTGELSEVYKPPPGYDLHTDADGQTIAINKEDPSKPPIVAYRPEDYDERRQISKQKSLLDIEKTKSDLATGKINQVDARVKLMNTLQGLEQPEPKFIGTSDIWWGPGTQGNVQHYNPETKTSTYEHYSGGPQSEQQQANIARIRSMIDELDKSMASGDQAKTGQLAEQIKQADQGGQPAQPEQPRQEEQPGIMDVGQVDRGGQDIRPGWPGMDPGHLNDNLQPPTQRTTAAGDIAHYDVGGALTGIDYLNTAPPHYGEEGYPGSEGYEGVGSTLQGGLSDASQPTEEQPPEYQTPAEGDDYWDRRRLRYMGTGTDIPQGGQGTTHKPAGRPGYPTEPSAVPSLPTSAPALPQASPLTPPPAGGPGLLQGGPMPPTGATPPMPGAPPPGMSGAPPQDPAALAAQPDFNPLAPPDLAALGPPGGGAGAMPGAGAGAAPGGPPGLDDPLFQYAMQRRRPQMGGGQEGGISPGGGTPPPTLPTAAAGPSPGGSYAGWTPPVPQDDVAGIGHRFGQPMNVGEPFHSGVDLQAVEGTPTIAPVDGVVQRIEYNPQGLGITVVLQGKDGTVHKLGHLEETSAYPGLVVSQGQDLQSKVGSTGNTTGSHLHWAVKNPNGQPTDPTASLGAMANLPPVPGTQMMGPPGGSSTPGGPGPGGAPASASTPGPLAVPTQGMPPTPSLAAQPGPGGQQPMGMGADDDPFAELRAEQEARRKKRREEAASKWAPTGKSSEVPQTGEPQDEEETWWQDPEDRPRVYEPGQGMAGRGTTTGRSPGGEVGGRYQRSEELRGQTNAEQRGRKRSTSDIPGSANSPYREGITNPYSPESPEGKEWQRQNDWFRAKRQPKIVLNERLDRLVEQGWPQEAVDELKDLGRPPTRADIEWIRNRYKGLPAPPSNILQPVLGDTRRGMTQEEVDAANAAAELRNAPPEPAPEWGPDTPNKVPAPAEHAERIKQAWAPQPESPTGNPQSVLDRLSPGGKRLREKSLARGPLVGLPPEGPGEQALKPGWEPKPDMLGLEENGGLNPGEPKWEAPVDESQMEPDPNMLKQPDADDWAQEGVHHMRDIRTGKVRAYYDPPPEVLKYLVDPDEMGWEPPEGSTGGTLGNKMVTPPIETGGGHKPPVGPDIRDIIGKPNIFMPPSIPTGGHVPVPLPDFPKGHVPGPEIKLPNITDLPHPDIKLPDWFPGQGQPQAQPEGGTAESYSDMLDRLRNLGMGQDEGDGDDVQIAQALGCTPDEITDEIRAWWSARPQPQTVPPGDDGMGAGMQVGPVHLATSMRQPMRMPSSRMETSRRAGWTPRTGGMKRRPSMGTSAMMKV